MKTRSRTRFAACALPLAFALAAQGGSCGGQATRGNTEARTNANAPARAGANANADGGGKGEAEMPEQRAGVAAAGTWGGPGVRLEVSKAGDASAEFDCAHGTLGKISLDSSGRFDVRGAFVRERGGPARSDEAPEETPARYAGRVEGQTMTLRVSVKGLDEQLSFTLTHGRAGRLRKCL